LKIAEDIFTTGGGKAPKMTPSGTASPPISTPAPADPQTGVGVGMPTVPIQPASVDACADAPPKPSQKGAKVAKPPKEGAPVTRPRPERVTQPYPKGLSPR
jgi:hypothetical protein